MLDKLKRIEIKEDENQSCGEVNYLIAIQCDDFHE